MILNNGTYDKLKFLALVVLPAAAALYYGVAQVWGLPNAENVIGTAAVIDTFLGVLLKASSSKYRKSDVDTADGDLYLNHDEDGTYLTLGVNNSVAAMASKDMVSLKIVHRDAPPK